MRRSRRLVPALTVLALPMVTATSCAPPPHPPPSCAPTGTSAQRNLRYAATPGVAAGLQSLDLYLPVRASGCAPTPVVVYVHGGGFQVGDKANQITDKVNLFTKAGWAFASLNYRLVGNPGSGSTNGMYPAAEQDVAAGIAFLNRSASKYKLDAKHVMLLGHSAGAQLVALVSTDRSFLAREGLRLGDVTCTSPLDSTYDIPTQVAGGGMNAQMYTAAFGTDPAIWAKGSPNRNVAAGKGIPSFHIVSRGGPARVSQARSFGSVLRAAGVAADVQDVAGLSHEAVNDRVGLAGDTMVTPPLMSFFRECAQRA